MPSILEKQVAGAIVEASCKFIKKLRTRVYRVIKYIGRSSIKMSIIGA